MRVGPVEPEAVPDAGGVAFGADSGGADGDDCDGDDCDGDDCREPAGDAVVAKHPESAAATPS